MSGSPGGRQAVPGPDGPGPDGPDGPGPDGPGPDGPDGPGPDGPGPDGPGPDGPGGPGQNRGPFPLGAAVTMRDLDGELHPLLRRLREREPVSWLPVLGGWLVTRRDLALRVLRDTGTFTVDDPRFSTARVIGPSMLSLDGAEHKRHRDPFAEAFRATEVQDRLEGFVEAEAERLVSGFAAAGRAELRRDLAGPLAVAVVADVLGLGQADPAVILSWYDEIVGAVSALAGESGEPASEADPVRAGEPEEWGQPGQRHAPGAGARGAEAFGELSASLESVISGGTSGPHGNSLLAAAAGAGGLRRSEVVSNAAVLAFGGIETTEGMICNAVLYLLSHPGQLREVVGRPAPGRERRGGVAAARARRRGRGPLRHRRRPARRGGDPARGSGHRLAGRGGPGPGVLPGPGPVRRAARERPAEPGVRARPAFLPRSPPGPAGGQSRHGDAAPDCCPACGWIPRAGQRRAGWCSASRPPCTCGGMRRPAENRN